MGGEYGSWTLNQPIGIRLAVWRARRGIDAGEVADRCGLSLRQLMGLESGQDWTDRYGLLTRAADALRVDPGFLTGQPYPPSNASQALVTGVTHRIRRLVGR
ncbi:MAG: hypothetical protein QG622_79, partial [Actinomycetota bacterium]|nr:hypothetical protein [Actinomycetota bacterium]